MIRFLLIFLFFVCLINRSIANNGFIQKYKIGVYLGSRSMLMDSLTPSTDLDFVNCFEKQTGGIEYFTLGVSVDFKIKKNWETGIDLLMQDGIKPSNYKFSVSYLPHGYFGINLGIYGYSYFIENFDYLFKLNEPYIITLDDDNYFQKVAKDIGFIAGPVLKYDLGSFHSSFYLNVGLISTRSFSQPFIQKQLGSNFRRNLLYETQPTWSFMLFPEVKLSYDAFLFNKSIIGFQVHSNFLYQKKNINYELVTSEWTNEKEDIRYVNSPKHALQKFELEFGIYAQW